MLSGEAERRAARTKDGDQRQRHQGDHDAAVQNQRESILKSSLNSELRLLAGGQLFFNADSGVQLRRNPQRKGGCCTQHRRDIQGEGRQHRKEAGDCRNRCSQLGHQRDAGHHAAQAVTDNHQDDHNRQSSHCGDRDCPMGIFAIGRRNGSIVAGRQRNWQRAAVDLVDQVDGVIGG